ncbi:MAG: YggT family protein [Parvibaculales bacterium]
MQSLLILISQIIELYIWVVIASVIMSWLISFNVVNIRNRFVYNLSHVINRLTEPAYRQVRQLIPPIGGLDLSPIVIIFALTFLRNLMWETLG